MTELGNIEYDYIRQLVHAHSRIHLGPDKHGLVSRRVRRRLAALGLADFRTYCSFLRSPDGRAELPALMDVISTNVTNFFREPQHFDFLRRDVLPAWEARHQGARQRVFRVWSAACSSGEEPYSIAMVLAEYFRDRPGGAWQVEASDISTEMLAQASEGIYRAERVTLPEGEWLARYFQKGVGRHEGHSRVKEALRSRTRFHHLNLFQAVWPFTPDFDVIFCRNVMIYFDRQAQGELVQRLAGQLASGGCLFVGHAESLIGIPHPLTSVRPSIYRKTA